MNATCCVVLQTVRIAVSTRYVLRSQGYSTYINSQLHIGILSVTNRVHSGNLFYTICYSYINYFYDLELAITHLKWKPNCHLIIARLDVRTQIIAGQQVHTQSHKNQIPIIYSI